MSYASYEQEQQDQEVFQKLVTAHKAKEQSEKELKLAELLKARSTLHNDIKWMVNATPIQNGIRDISETFKSIGVAMCGECDTECEKK